MLKKGVTLVKFTRPASAMRVVLDAVNNNCKTKTAVKKQTGLKLIQVEAALRNLIFTGAVIRTEKVISKKRRSFYHSKQESAEC